MSRLWGCQVPLEGPDTASRRKVYALLVSGRTIGQAAQEIGITEATVHYHKGKLVGAGVLQPMNPGSSPLFYEPGPRASEYERVNNLDGRTDRVGRGRPANDPPDGPLGLVRIHGDQYRVRISGGLEEEPEWDREWSPDGVTRHASFRTMVAGLEVRFWLIHGKRGSSLTVQLGEQWTGEEGVVERAERHRVRAARQAVEWFRERFGAEWEGPVKRTRLTEFGFALGEGGRSESHTVSEDQQVWVDESPGVGQPEVETRDVGVASAVAGLPSWQEELEERLKEVSSWQERMLARLEVAEASEDKTKQVLERLVDMQETNADVHRLLTEALVEARAGSGEVEPGPVEEGPGDEGGPGPEVH